MFACLGSCSKGLGLPSAWHLDLTCTINLIRDSKYHPALSGRCVFSRAKTPSRQGMKIIFPLSLRRQVFARVVLFSTNEPVLSLRVRGCGRSNLVVWVLMRSLRHPLRRIPRDDSCRSWLRICRRVLRSPPWRIPTRPMSYLTSSSF